MGHERRHRGAHPADESLFSQSQLGKLRKALQDYCWLLSHGYAPTSSLKLVGDRFQLTQRQRMLLMRSACTTTQRERREHSRQSAAQIAGCDLHLDGFNILITVESALSGGFVFIGQDGCYRDLSSVHGTYKRVQETRTAITLIGEVVLQLGANSVIWYLDKPVSNSGQLRKTLQDVSEQHQWDWRVELHQSPDFELKRVPGTVVTTDSVILDAVPKWFALHQEVVDRCVSNANLINLNFTEPVDSNCR